MSRKSHLGTVRTALSRRFVNLVIVAAAALVALQAAVALAAQTHIVQPGESLSGIADHYGVPMDAIAKENNIADVDRIHAGQVLRINQTVSPVVRVHVVERGDSVGWIATHYRVSVGAVISRNGW